MGLRCHLVIVAESAKSNCILYLLTKQRGNGQDWFPWQPQTGGGGAHENIDRSCCHQTLARTCPHKRGQRCTYSHHNPPPRYDHGAVADGFQQRVWILLEKHLSLMYALQREKLWLILSRLKTERPDMSRSEERRWIQGKKDAEVGKWEALRRSKEVFYGCGVHEIRCRCRRDGGRWLAERNSTEEKKILDKGLWDRCLQYGGGSGELVSS